jgi:hypothetical protein
MQAPLRITVNDSMQQHYVYELSAPIGGDFDAGFNPHFSPKEMLKLGVFEGKYLNDCTAEFPPDWFADASIGDRPDPALNFFGVKSRQSLPVWRENGWILEPDPRGWFQWYCRYYLGRRIPDVDAFQIKRWRAFTRHAAQIKRNCLPCDLECRPRQRQALLHWSHDAFI